MIYPMTPIYDPPFPSWQIGTGVSCGPDPWLLKQLDKAARDWAALPYYLKGEPKPRIRVKAGREVIGQSDR